MKLICPPEDWKNYREISYEESDLVDWIVKKLGLSANYDAKNLKYYLGLPSDAKQPAAAQAKSSADNVLRFTVRLPKQATSAIVDGVIMINGQMFKACSGCAGSQVYGSYWITGRSPIPPGRDYKVDLKWSYSDLAGIAGRYYHILPDPIERGDGSGLRRTEIGLHQDNGVPGTSGCIGVVGSDWSRLCVVLDELAKFSRYLKLEVSYLCQD
ncbi:hypothetical protein IJT17_10110 [bacterium]|nr:hypothetical protein [bacterium]